jgi:hypothetical protein
MARKSNKITKVQMVRDAIDNLGWNAKGDEYVSFIKDKYKVEMSKAHISQTKTAERKIRGVRGKSRKSAAAASTVPSASVADILSFVDAVKTWEQKIGAAGIREVVKNVLKK